MSKLALVTGGTRGIGGAMSIALKNAGFTVIANFRNDYKSAEKFSKQNSIYVKNWDVTNYDQCALSVREIEEQFSNNISVLINNAGIIRDSIMHKMSPDIWQEVINTNLNSCYNMCLSVIPQMRKQHYGRIINISSVNAQIGQVGQVNYSAAKAGVLGFSKALARESASKGITVNCIAPGYIDTEMLANIPEAILNKIISNIPMQRLGTPADIARTVLFLSDENAGYITGETISINGGYNMH